MNAAFCELAKIDHRVISAYHPEANGLVERENRNILSSLRKLLQDPDTEWDVALYAIVAANNATAKRAHGWQRSPFELMVWRQPNIPLDECDTPEALDALSDGDIKDLMEIREKKVLSIQDVILRKTKASIEIEQV